MREMSEQAYLDKQQRIHRQLRRLEQANRNHYGFDLDKVDWGHVGNVNHIADGLDELLAFVEGPDETAREQLDRLMRKAMLRDGNNIRPCEGKMYAQCLSRHNNKVLFWYNDEYGNTHVVTESTGSNA